MPTVATTKRITERVSAPFAGCRVDREAGVIYGVKLCGFTSLNDRDYPPEMFRRDFAKYENVPINFNHGRERLVENVGGRIRKPRVDADGTPRGDAHLLKSHPMYERVMEAAEKDPGLFGFSHVALCRTSSKGGRERVEGMDSVESVDLVAQPATTKGFFEDIGVKISLKAFVERFGARWGAKRWAAATKLCEDIGGMADAPMMDAPPDDVTDGDLKSALMAALAPLLDEAFESGDADKAVSALKDFIKLHAKHSGKGPADDKPTDDTAEEGKKPTALTLPGLLAECKAAGLNNPTADHLAELSEVSSAKGRAAMIGAFKKATEAAPERPQSHGRGSITPTPATGSTAVTESKPPAEGKAFASWIK